MQKLTINYSGMTVEISADDPRDIWPAAAFWTSLPETCPVCRAGLTFEYATPKTYKYYKLKCTGDRPHCVNLGQRQADGSLYFDRAKSWELFRHAPNDSDDSTTTPAAAAQGSADHDRAEHAGVILSIKELYSTAKERGLAVDRVDLDALNSKSIGQLRGIQSFIESLIARDRSRLRQPS